MPFLDQTYAAIDAAYGDQVNIVEFTWANAFTVLGGAPLRTADLAGVALGQALSNLLGSNYSQNVHMIGHSYGTVVNANAASELSYAGGIDTAQMTILDAPTQNNVVATIPTNLYTLSANSKWVGYVDNYYGTIPFLAYGTPISGAELNGGYSYHTDHQGVWQNYLATVGHLGSGPIKLLAHVGSH